MNLAGQFKSAARLAAESLDFWFNFRPLHHIKNRFPLKDKIGCEGYGYFDKYMVTMGSWAYLCYNMSDDTIPEIPCPALNGGYTYETSSHFHKVFLSAGGYFAEYDINADYHYDCSGLGRIHKAGAPSALCLTVPCPLSPSYTLGSANPAPLSISCGAKLNGNWYYASAENAAHSCVEKNASGDRASALFTCKVAENTTLRQIIALDGCGVTVTAKGADEIALELPVFYSDGDTKTEIRSDEHTVTVCYSGWKVQYKTDGTLNMEESLYGNRNGLYRRCTAEGKEHISVHIEISQES